MDLNTHSARWFGRVPRLLALALAAVTLPLAAQTKDSAGAKKPKAAPTTRQPKQPKEAPDSAKAAKWKEEAEALPLFKSDAPLSLTLVADYRTVLRDRDTLSTKLYPGTLILRDSAGGEKKIPVEMRGRGHFRIQSRNCDFIPLRINLPKKELKGTVLEGQDRIKLGTHCRPTGEYEQYVLREYLAYKVHNTLTDRSMRVRLAKVTYNDSVSGKSLGEHNAILFENDNDVAKRMGGQIVQLRHALFDDVEPAQLNQVAVFEYFIGNTDWSLYALHNIRLVRRPDGTLLPLAYDLDFSGLVDTRYATPAEQLNIRSVKDRLYRGPCRTPADFDAALGVYRQNEAKILAIYDTFPGLDQGYVQSTKGYLGDFFKMMKKPGDVKSTFVDSCTGKPSV